MKKLAIVLVVLVAMASMSWGQVTVGGVTDGYIIGGEEGGKMTAGQDVNIGVGPFSAVLKADWTKTLWDGGNTIALAYTLGYTQAFGIFTPKVEFTGDHSYAVEDRVWTGDLFSDLIPSLNINFEPFGVDLYSDMSFEEGYEFLQSVDASAYYNFAIGSVRAGFLYMDAQAVTDDDYYPNAPAAREGYSFYAKASISY